MAADPWPIKAVAVKIATAKKATAKAKPSRVRAIRNVFASCGVSAIIPVSSSSASHCFLARLAPGRLQPEHGHAPKGASYSEILGTGVSGCLGGHPA
jgi:hypothetical protein